MAERYMACPASFVQREEKGMRRSLVIDPGLDKLQELLLGMVPGDEVSVARAVEVSGLDEAQCDAVLDALMKAGLMLRVQPGDYVRCRLEEVGAG
jgi:predicted transcriptional regulator of viral defense system